ncbi:MAG: T9SS type A sorting domain-containing protein [Candidatus Aegiribacteria sp.]|nr:T9SS type A sorting domain-containing protein [Candidatus Aegiribacteria sp.]
MNILKLSIIILVSASFSYAGSAIQTDWSGGQGVPGPVIEFGCDFFIEMGLDWWQAPGLLRLAGDIVEHVVDDNFDGAHSVHVSDIDGDSDLDILGAAYNANEFAWWENSDGYGTVWIKHLIASGFAYAYAIYSEDINDDGYIDVIGAAFNDNSITWWQNSDGSGNAWIEHQISDSFVAASAVYSEDIDGDGDMDVLGTARSDDEITWWENTDGTGSSWIEHTIDTNYDGARSVYAADIDGDGYMDVLGAAVHADEITWWENSDTTPGYYWVEHTIDQNFNGACAVYADDINGDGYMDVLGAAVHDDEITWWENTDGSGDNWISHVIDTYYDGAHSAISADLDNDGDVDVIGTAELADDVTWWENTDGSGLNWDEHLIEGNFEGAEWAWPADFNDDGFLDIVAAAEYADGINWWDIASSNGYLESSILDTEDNPDWDYLDWNSSTPDGTSLLIQIRSSDDHTVMGAWSDTLSIPCLLSDILDDGDQYVQYKVLMSTTDPDTTPLLYNIIITWNSLGIEGSSEPEITALLPFSPNPMSGAPVVVFSLEESAPVSLSIFDLSGRVVSCVLHEEYAQGFHEVQQGELTPGIYFCRMITEGFSATRRFTVID